MPENPLEQARFDHVDTTGELVFAVGNLRFAVNVDETLERAILEAKQIRAESSPAQTRSSETLPISQIQSLIRAGADPSRVAERYGLSEALVRRFSTAVETEKQYAIEQFLTVPAPKESHMRTIAELVESTLASARIGMETVSWRATRRGLEPWRITAQFKSSGRMIRAEWTWNMHDNAVTCLNAAAKKLLGEQTAGATAGKSEASAGDGFAAALKLPGDSIRSARIERAVSQWNAAQSSPADTDRDQIAADTARPASEPSVLPSAVPLMPSSSDATVPSDDVDSAPDDGRDAAAADHTDPSASADARPGAGAKDETAADKPNGQRAPREQGTPEPKRRSGRSAVPSWDEILFGN